MPGAAKNSDDADDMMEARYLARYMGSGAGCALASARIGTGGATPLPNATNIVPGSGAVELRRGAAHMDDDMWPRPLEGIVL